MITVLYSYITLISKSYTACIDLDSYIVIKLGEV